MDAFQDELESFKERVRGRAQARIEAAMKEVEEVCSLDKTCQENLKEYPRIALASLNT